MLAIAVEEEDSSESARGFEGAKRRPGKRLKMGDEELADVVSYVKTRRSRSLTFGEKLDVLLLQAELRHEVEKKDKNGRAKRVSEVTRLVAKYLHRKSNLVGEIWADYLRGKEIHLAKPGGNYNMKDTRVPRARSVVSLVQKFVRERRLSRTRTVARDVMDFLEECGFISVDRTKPQSLESAQRSVARFLCTNGYERAKKKGMMCYHLKEENIVKRDFYVNYMTIANNDPSRRIVYMDENYLHKNYCRHDDSLFDPNDEQDLEVKAQHKGKRFCFIAAIIEEDTHAAAPINGAADQDPNVHKAGLLHDTLDIFEGGKKQTEDYHGMFDTTYFIGWMQKLLDSLDRRGIKNAIIVMDNAKYHKTLPGNTPKGNWKKQDLIDYCVSNGIKVEAKELKSLIWDKVKRNVADNVKPVVVTMAQEKGHEVIYSPPHHSDLLPVELVWSVIKGEVGRQYSTTTTSQDVLVRLKRSFQELKSETISACIKKANKHIKELMENLLEVESVEDIEAEEAESDETSNDGSDPEF